MFPLCPSVCGQWQPADKPPGSVWHDSRESDACGPHVGLKKPLFKLLVWRDSSGKCCQRPEQNVSCAYIQWQLQESEHSVSSYTQRASTGEPRSTFPSVDGSGAAASRSPWCTPPTCWTWGAEPAERWPSTLLTLTTPTMWMTSWPSLSLHAKQVRSLSGCVFYLLL